MPQIAFYIIEKPGANYVDVELINKQYLIYRNIFMEKISPEQVTETGIDQYIKIIQTKEPYIERLSENTLLFRIPSFDYKYKYIIDSLVSANYNEITSTENLIFDLRNNPGGTDVCFDELLQFIYTNPYRQSSMIALATQFNIDRQSDFIKNSGRDSADMASIISFHNKLKANPGKSINLWEGQSSEHMMDTVYEFPKNVAVIINKNVASSAESFVRIAKQSRKTKIYGEPSAGCFDIANVLSAISPCGNYQLYYSLTKDISMDIMPVEEIGFQPDFLIYNDIPYYKWMEYVENLLNE